MQLSICIPTFNTDVFKLVDTIHTQCVRAEIEYEILIIDDASTALKFLSQNYELTKLDNVQIIRNEVNLGRTGTRRKAAELSKSNWILFLDADVVPVSENFIVNYVDSINSGYKIILGGYSYCKIKGSERGFRWNYGKAREEASSEVRNSKPYGYVFSGNILVEKNTFLESNFKEDTKLYGMDIFFSYQLYINKIPILHIDNPIIHEGLDENEVFFKKSMLSVKSRFDYLKNLSEIEKVNPLLNYYKKLDRFGLTKIVGFLFKTLEPNMKKRIVCDVPNLFLFDLYRLGYICTLEKDIK